MQNLRNPFFIGIRRNMLGMPEETPAFFKDDEFRDI